MATTSKSAVTCDHDTIRQWAEDRGAKPARVIGTGNGDAGLLRLDFPGYSGDRLQEISWDEFFKKFDDEDLCLVYQEQTSNGNKSNFNMIISRHMAEKPQRQRQ